MNEKILWYKEENHYTRGQAAGYRADWINERCQVDTIEREGQIGQDGLSQVGWFSSLLDRS